MNTITVLMYHYVRDLKKSAYPKIKCLDAGLFVEQLDYCARFYEFVSLERCIDAISGAARIPPNAVLLTFDDGYIDHYQCVFPILRKRNIPGCFFIPAQPLAEGRVLDVNKIHFILASEISPQTIIAEMFSLIGAARGKYNLLSSEEYLQKHASVHRFDDSEIGFIKKMLQRELPSSLRTEIIDALFKKYVTRDESSFAQSLYMNRTQILEMQAAGMRFGSHGYRHWRFNTLDSAQQEREIARSIDFLHNIGIPDAHRSMCYPYGEYNSVLLEILKKHGCEVAFTTEVAIAYLDGINSLLIPRLDTNDLPKNRHADANKWTKKILTHALQ